MREAIDEYLSVFVKHCPNEQVPKKDYIEGLAESAVNCEPKFVVNSSTKFFEVNGDACYISDYYSMGKIDFGEVAV